MKTFVPIRRERMLIRLCSLLLTAVLLCTPLAANAAEAETPLIPTAAVADMTWGVNLTDLFIADVDYSQGNPVGYCKNAPFGMAIWFWNSNYDWLHFVELRSDKYTVEISIPKYDENVGITDWIGGLFHIGVMSETQHQPITLTFSDCKIIKSNNDVIDLDFLEQTYSGTASIDPGNGFYRYDPEYNKKLLPQPSAELDGAKLSITVTADVPFEDKAEYFYQLNREEMDAKELVDLFLAQGVNVFRLPITWTSFINDTTFEIDKCWFEKVQEVVDYILANGAYCIINMHNDYLTRSYVGDHWEEEWMYPQYKEYVDARFAAVWRQIATYFKDYPDHLIFEPFNEPTMQWHDKYETSTYHFELELARVSELNNLFVSTVRATGGKNATRLLCLAAAHYNDHKYLGSLELPANDPYLMVQIHSYSAMEINDATTVDTDFDYVDETNKLFETLDSWMIDHPGIPIIIGEVGTTHKESDEVQAQKVAYYFQRAEQSGIPCLWWEDFFYTETGYQYWLYDKKTQEWGRPLTLAAIRNAATALRIEVTAGGELLQFNSSCKKACAVYAALYDVNGKLLECQTASRAAGAQQVSLTFSSATLPEGYTVKVFLLDGNFCPLTAPLS